MNVHEFEDSHYLSGRGKIHCGLTRIFTPDNNCIVSILRRCACLKPCLLLTRMFQKISYCLWMSSNTDCGMRSSSVRVTFLARTSTCERWNNFVSGSQ